MYVWGGRAATQTRTVSEGVGSPMAWAAGCETRQRAGRDSLTGWQAAV